ncbi:MAG: hypothetical protein ABI623_11890 [bacterium]
MKCSSCGSTRVYRSKTRTSTEKFIHSILPIHYYRCHACDSRRMKFQRRTMNIIIMSILGLLFGFLVFELASPVIRLMLHLVLS